MFGTFGFFELFECLLVLEYLDVVWTRDVGTRKSSSTEGPSGLAASPRKPPNPQIPKALNPKP